MDKWRGAGQYTCQRGQGLGRARDQDNSVGLAGREEVRAIEEYEAN